MTALGVWDWHYCVGFDEPLRRQVADVAARLPDIRHQKVLASQLEAHSIRFSLARLLESVSDGGHGDIDSLLDTASGSEPYYLPPYLAEKYLTRILRARSLTGSQQTRLKEFVRKAVSVRYESPHRIMFSPIFGESLTRMLRNRTSTIEPAEPGNTLMPNDLLQWSERIVGSLKKQMPHRLQSLGSSIPRFHTSLTPGPGFAEYWPTSLSEADRNELVIYKNRDQLGYSNFFATIAHEVVGHGTFYKIAEESEPPFFDHGAISFIEGWATWCEWTASSPAFARHLRSARCRSLTRFDSEDTLAIQNGIRADSTTLGYSAEVAESGIENFFQYPGFGLSYALGALWFEERLANEDPRHFLDSLADQPWGDFFTLW